MLVGNPPWLAFRFMAAQLQGTFQRRAKERHLWHGGARGRTTQQDLSAFFVARCIELYLRTGGRFGFVMPRAVLSRQTYGGFRSGDYSTDLETCCVAFDQSWDLQHVEPALFPVPSAVVFGARTSDRDMSPLASSVLAWSGAVPSHGTGDGTLISTPADVTAMSGDEVASPYRERFRDGAILYPRMLIMVTDPPAAPLGVPQGRQAVRSRQTSLDKPPWRNLAAQDGIVESIFVRPAYLGESIGPFRVLSVEHAVIPYDGTRLLNGDDERIDRYPGLARWWRDSESLWLTHRSSEKRSLAEQLDYLGQLRAQFPISPIRVVYSKAGNHLAAAIIEDSTAVIDHMLYWSAVATIDEAHYLTAVLTASVLTDLVRPFQSVGAFGPRHFDKYVWQAPIPLFDPGIDTHRHLADLGGRAELLAADVVVPVGERFQAARGRIRASLENGELHEALNTSVRELLQL